ncbi:hypothetical protein Ancab_022498 [Ancistrocladus abbreviatus]
MAASMWLPSDNKCVYTLCLTSHLSKLPPHIPLRYITLSPCNRACPCQIPTTTPVRNLIGEKMAAVSSVSLSTPRLMPNAAAAGGDISRVQAMNSPFFVNFNSQQSYTRSFQSSGMGRRVGVIRPVAGAPDKLSDKVAESVKEAEELCEGDPTSGECVAAWDTVEEMSAAASHARDRKEEFDPLESFCKDNPESDECRTYDN